MKLKKIKIYKKILEKIYHCFQNQTEIYVWSDYVNGKLVINPTSKNHKIENAKKKKKFIVNCGQTGHDFISPIRFSPLEKFTQNFN